MKVTKEGVKDKYKKIAYNCSQTAWLGLSPSLTYQVTIKHAKILLTRKYLIYIYRKVHLTNSNPQMILGDLSQSVELPT